MADEELLSLPDRLKVVQQDVEDAEGALRLRRRQRRRLVVQTVDTGAMSQRQIAEALGGKSPGLVSKILSQTDEDE